MNPKLAFDLQILTDTLRKKRWILTHLLNLKFPDKTAHVEDEEEESSTILVFPTKEVKMK